MKSIIYISILFFLSLYSLKAQEKSRDSRVSDALYEQYDRSDFYLASFKIDSARMVLDSILAQIKGTELEESPFGLRTLVRKGQALERDDEGDKALLILHDVKAKAKSKEVWDAYAVASINLALQYEKIGRGGQCLENLRAAQSVINTYPELDNLYPFFCVRISSYHRLYDDRDSSFYYANECIRTYEKYNDYAQGGDGYMLLVMLTDPAKVDERIQYAKASAKLFADNRSQTAHSYMIGTLAGLYYSKAEYKNALQYNDTAIIASQTGIKEGFSEYRSLYNAYKFRGEIFKKLNQLDSATYYLRKGYDLQNEHMINESQAKVVSMVAKYEDGQKAQKIKEQEAQLRSEKTRQKLIMIIFGLLAGLTLALAYAYAKVRKSKNEAILLSEEVKKTNLELSKSLKKQIVLQGEVHHRVKNNLQVIISLLDLHKDELTDQNSKMKIDSMSQRIYSMSAIHNLLYQKEDMEFIKLLEYIEDLCYHFSNFSYDKNKPVFHLDIADVNLNLETSMPIGIIVTELLNNSLKYGRVENKKLEISIHISRKEDGLEISYSDNGPGFDNLNSDMEKAGLGFYILDSMTRQLQGKLVRENNNGASYTIFVKEKNKK